ncbi:MAG: S41 family peptidase, partial [Anaerovoracaceae bacterium]
MNMTKIKLVTIIALSLIIGAVGSFFLVNTVRDLGLGNVNISQKEFTEYQSLKKKYSKLEELNNAINENYYKSTNQTKLMEGVYKGLFEGLDDPYSGYMNKEEFDAWMSSTKGEYEGIGITFAADRNNNFVIVSLQKNSPASKAGLKVGDIIALVDGKEFTDLDKLGNAIRGEKGSEVNLVVLRGKNDKKFRITRAKIVNQTVESKVLDGNIGYIKVTGFELNTATQFDKQLKSLEDKKVKALVVDMRDNG